jgi:multiple sugar transport system ATP-binding protein
MEIKLQKLTKVFPGVNGREGTTAVDSLDIVIPDGQLVGLLGPSGCGKSTTLYMISGLLEPTSGRIFFGEEDVTDLTPEKRGIGLVFQNYALYPHMTIRKNIAFPLQNVRVEEKNADGTVTKRKLTKEETESLVVETAKLVQIENLLDRKPNQLSGGQQQRVAIARALVKKPRVLLLDEPLSNLDARLRLQTREEIKRLQRETGITTVFVTHDQEEAMSISDEIVVMKLGVEQQRGAPQEVYNNPKNKFVAEFLGTPPINMFEGTVKDNKLYIGEEQVLALETEVEDQEVYVGIRPEGFIVDKKGKLSAEVEQIETLGRDISIIAKNPNTQKPTFKAIIDADIKVSVGAIKFSVKPNKCFVFSKETEERLA